MNSSKKTNNFLTYCDTSGMAIQVVEFSMDPTRCVHQNEIEGQSEDMRFLGPSKDTRF